MAPPRKDKCDCGFLERASEKPNSPIRYDPEMNEYHIVYGSSATGGMIIYYCPHCGGRVPESRRATLFAHITEAESHRIRSLIKDLKTVAEVLAHFGPPDEERPGGSRKFPETDGRPPREDVFSRTLVYKNVSDVVEVIFSVGANDLVSASWYGKYIGPKKP